jgi:hypothetical protein
MSDEPPVKSKPLGEGLGCAVIILAIGVVLGWHSVAALLHDLFGKCR